MPTVTETLQQEIRAGRDPHFSYVVNRFTPFAHAHKPLDQSRVVLITTAGLYLSNQFHAPFDISAPHGDASFREFPSNAALSDLALAHPGYDHRYASEDMNVVFPLPRLHELARHGAIGEVAPVAYSFMGHITRPRELLSDYLLNLVQRVRRMGADLALVAAVGLLCHQTAALIARSLEAAGIPTLTVGTVPDFWPSVRPPRAVWVQHPPGATFGQPGNAGKQQQILQDVFLAFAEMTEPDAVVQLPYTWPRA